MLRSMMAAVSGMRAHQMMMDVVANDIANVNTVGYKASRTSFKDSLSQLQRSAAAPGPSTGGSAAIQIGLGVQLGSIDNVMQSGSIESTGNVLDVAIQGDGWFRVAQGAPPALPTGVEYTRAGNFTLNQNGYMTTQDGYYVMGLDAVGSGGNPVYLQIPPGSTDVAVGQDGSVSYVPAGGGARTVAGYISLAKFANEAALERSSGNRWAASANSGTEQLGTPADNGYGAASSGTVEMSNVDLAQEFTNMITAQRGFEANSKLIAASDELLQNLVNLVR